MMTSKQQLKFIFGMACAALLFYGAVQFLSENDETRIRRTINAATLALENSDAAGYSRIISESYLDDYGNDKKMLLDVTAKIFKEYQPVKADIKKLVICIENVTAQADIGFKCYFKKSQEKQMYYDTGRIIAFFRREGKYWKVVMLEYQGSNDILFLPAVA